MLWMMWYAVNPVVSIIKNRSAKAGMSGRLGSSSVGWVAGGGGNEVVVSPTGEVCSLLEGVWEWEWEWEWEWLGREGDR